MKRKITNLEQELINSGWILTTKKYMGKHSNKIYCYEYHKTSDLRNDNKTYDQIIMLNQKRTQIVDYGINNVYVDFLNDQQLCVLRFLHLELKHFVDRLIEKKPLIVNVPNSEYDEQQEVSPMTFEEMDMLCEQLAKEND